MGAFFDRASLLAAFDAIGAAARRNDTRLEIAIYGGAALMLASNFRFATEDVDIAEIGTPWPEWLSVAVRDVAERHGWAEDWLTDAVTFHLSPLAEKAVNHIEFGSFPRDGRPGLDVLVPSAPYLLALRLKAMRILDAVKGPREADDIRGLMRVLEIDAEGALAILDRYFPRSAADSGKQAFLLRHLGRGQDGDDDAPRYGR